MNTDIKEAIQRRYGVTTPIKKGVSAIITPELTADRVRGPKSGEGCIINGVRYSSLTEAARVIDPIKLTPSEVRRRCYSQKIRYKNWRLEGLDKKPLLKISIDGYLFESAGHAHQYLPSMSKALIENRCMSGNPQYRHWMKLETPVSDVSYEEMETALEGMTVRPIRERITTIRCEGIEFYSQSDAAEHFGLTVERIRQKLESDIHTDFEYLY